MLVNLNGAQKKGGDAAVESNLNGIRPQAALVYSDLGSYGIGVSGTAGTVVVCSAAAANSLAATTTVSAQIAAAVKAGSGTATCSTDVTSAVGSKAQSWFVAATLKTKPLEAWCVDSEGASKKVLASAVAAALPNVTTCP